MKSYVVHLIRNAPCEGNLEGKYIGRTESPIAMEGMEQLLEFKRNYKYPELSNRESVKGYFASPSVRCVDTLKILYPEASDPEVILELAECDFGDFEDKTPEELKDNEAYKLWIEDGGKSAPPNGESGADFGARALSGFNMLVENLMHRGITESVLVTYGGVIMTILATHGLPQADFYEWMCEPGAGYSIRITPSIWMRSQLVEVFQIVPKANDDYEEEDIFPIDDD